MTPPIQERRHGVGFFHDEKGGRSMGRLLLLVNTGFILYLIHRHVFDQFDVSGPAWALLTTMQGAFTVWVVGPRVGQQITDIFKKGVDSVKETANAEVRARRKAGGTEETP